MTPISRRQAKPSFFVAASVGLAGKQARARFHKVDGEDGSLGLLAVAVVHFQSRDDRRQETGAQIGAGRCVGFSQAFGVGMRFGNRREGSVNAEREIRRGPGVGRPMIMTLNFFSAVTLQGSARIGCGRVRLKIRFGGRGNCLGKKRQAADRRLGFSIAMLNADVQILPRRLSQLQADPAATAKMAAGKAHKRANRRVVGIEIELAVERQTGSRLNVKIPCFS
jgi:hypothetical protein